MTHSILPPSGAGIWGKPGGCTGWVMMNQAYPEDESSEASREGETAHEIAQDIIVDAKTAKHTPEDWVGITSSNGTVITGEMFDGAKMYADDVTAVMRKTGIFCDKNIGVEKRVEAKSIHDLSFGTPDCFIYDSAKYVLYIWDFKFGHRAVSEFENWQMINYLVGILEFLNLSDADMAKVKVKFRIVQPRAYHAEGGPIREWAISLKEVSKYFSQLKGAAAKSLSEHAELKTGSHCRDCNARHACSAALKAGMGLYEVAAKPMPIELPPDAMGVQLGIVKRAIEALKLLETGYEEQVKQYVLRGESMPGWTTEETTGRRDWDKPIEEVIAMGEMMGQDLKKPQQAITPAQSIKLGIDTEVVMAYSSKKSTGIKVISDTSSKAKRVFS